MSWIRKSASALEEDQNGAVLIHSLSLTCQKQRKRVRLFTQPLYPSILTVQVKKLDRDGSYPQIWSHKSHRITFQNSIMSSLTTNSTSHFQTQALFLFKRLTHQKMVSLSTRHLPTSTLSQRCSSASTLLFHAEN